MSAKTKPRELAKQETREALIRAGMAAFSEEGVDLPSLDAICARAGFTRGAFYVHFKDREDLFAAVADQALADFVNWVISTGDDEAGLAGVVERFIGVLEEGRRSVSGTQKLLMQIVARGSQQAPAGGEGQPYRAVIAGAVERLSQIVEHGQQHGKVRRDLEPAQLGLLLVSSSVGFITLLGGGLEPDFAQVRTLIARWLFVPPADPTTPP